MADDDTTDWLQAGDALASSDEPRQLEQALAAYEQVPVAHPDYPRALAGRAWVTFLLDRTPEAIRGYVALLDRLTGPSPDPMREQALHMLGAMLADPDWNRDGTPDTTTARARLSDATLVPQDRAWLGELYFATARSLYLSSRDVDAITLFDESLHRWPASPGTTTIEAACRRHLARPDGLHTETPSVRLATDALCQRYANTR